MTLLKYFSLAIAAFPLLPVMYFQGKRVRASVPELPEAKCPKGIIEKQGTPFQILTLGESTIAGVGVATHEEGFSGSLAAALAEKLNRTVEYKVIAKTRFNIKQIHEKLFPAASNSFKATDVFSPNLIVIGTGANDAFELNFPWRFQKGAGILIEKLRKRFPQTPIVFCNMPPIKSFPAFTPLIKFVIGNLVEIHGAFLEKEVAKHENVFFNYEKITLDKWIDLLPAEDLKDDDFFSDGVHPSQMTYQAWGKEIGRFVYDEKIIET